MSHRLHSVLIEFVLVYSHFYLLFHRVSIHTYIWLSNLLPSTMDKVWNTLIAYHEIHLIGTVSDVADLKIWRMQYSGDSVHTSHTNRENRCDKSCIRIVRHYCKEQAHDEEHASCWTWRCPGSTYKTNQTTYLIGLIRRICKTWVNTERIRP